MRWSTVVGSLFVCGSVLGSPLLHAQVTQAVTEGDPIPLPDPFARMHVARQADPSAITVLRVLYPTGFDGFTPSPTSTSEAASALSSGTLAGSSPPNPSETGSTQSGSSSDDSNGATKAIAIVVPIALGTVLVLALGGMLVMWRRKKAVNEDSKSDDDRESPIETVSIRHSLPSIHGLSSMNLRGIA